MDETRCVLPFCSCVCKSGFGSLHSAEPSQSRAMEKRQAKENHSIDVFLLYKKPYINPILSVFCPVWFEEINSSCAARGQLGPEGRGSWTARSGPVPMTGQQHAGLAPGECRDHRIEDAVCPCPGQDREYKPDGLWQAAPDHGLSRGLCITARQPLSRRPPGQLQHSSRSSSSGSMVCSGMATSCTSP